MNLWLRFLHWFASLLMRRDIYREDAALYMTRYRIMGWMPGSRFTWPFSVYLHQFHLPDSDDAPHSHPWKWAFGLVLAGGYTELRLVTESWHPNCAERRFGIRRLGRWRFNLLRNDTFHAIKQLHGETWTLFVAGPKATSWGFFVPGRGVVPWRERLRERGITPDH